MTDQPSIFALLRERVKALFEANRRMCAIATPMGFDMSTILIHRVSAEQASGRVLIVTDSNNLAHQWTSQLTDEGLDAVQLTPQMAIAHSEGSVLSEASILVLPIQRLRNGHIQAFLQKTPFRFVTIDGMPAIGGVNETALAPIVGAARSAVLVSRTLVDDLTLPNWANDCPSTGVWLADISDLGLEHCQIEGHPCPLSEDEIAFYGEVARLRLASTGAQTDPFRLATWGRGTIHSMLLQIAAASDGGLQDSAWGLIDRLESFDPDPVIEILIKIVEKTPISEAVWIVGSTRIADQSYIANSLAELPKRNILGFSSIYSHDHLSSEVAASASPGTVAVMTPAFLARMPYPNDQVTIVYSSATGVWLNKEKLARFVGAAAFRPFKKLHYIDRLASVSSC